MKEVLDGLDKLLRTEEKRNAHRILEGKLLRNKVSYLVKSVHFCRSDA
jgi:hypothetical protein